ncbi:MAG: transcriptional regulator [Pseudomonadota bacterium]
MMRQNQSPSYTELLLYARKAARHIDEAEDLLQAILLAAVEAGRTDLSCSENRRWLFGALKKRAAFDARSAVRRQKRETSATLTPPEESAEQPQANHEEPTSEFVQTLPPSLRSAALLALTGHTKAEIAWLLRISDTALRQRIAQIKRRWRQFDGSALSGLSTLKGELAFGQIRQALLQMTRCSELIHTHAILASHDPDGHLFVVSSQNDLSRQRKGVPTNKEEIRNVE